MAGIYLHIPYCKQACHYCDFHFSTNRANMPALVAAIQTELQMQIDYLNGETIETIYFGGGTPSLLSDSQLFDILSKIYNLYSVSEKAEITLEANPDDINWESLQLWKGLGINRLSIGIQSFHEPHLVYMNRAHNVEMAENCVKLAHNAGFENISIDLIYGIPSPDHSIWENDVKKALALQVPHISAYCLTIEPKTKFGRMAAKNELLIATDDFAACQYEYLVQGLQTAGYVHYEVSNYAKPSRESRHNMAYWQQKPYLGIGPSAHGFDGTNRQHNIAANAAYIQEINKGKVPAKIEVLLWEEKINDYILTSLRTRWGLDLNHLKSYFQYDLYHENAGFVDTLIKQQLAHLENQRLWLSDKGMFLADGITERLMIEVNN